ncbi:sulfatase-like hydrolase/transferase, partial [Aeromonas veronii]|uniref:sulfatase-like hydrolase/transferase n=1 Tax=Aeromonas veronii TaxID=654 RepID=UPI0038B55312
PGQEFNDTRRNRWGAGIKYSPYQVQVPLVLAWPGRGCDVREQPSSHFDLAQTLMQCMLVVSIQARDY